MMDLSPGKRMNLRRLADASGRFKMLAIDQRNSLKHLLRPVLQREVTSEDLTQVKQLITRELATHASAVLTDPMFGYPQSLEEIPSDVGLLLAAEATDYEQSGPDQRERRTLLCDGWSAPTVQRIGANAVKLLLYYHPHASVETRTHQQALVQQVGQACHDQQLPFLLELVGYPLGDEVDRPADFARDKPERVSAGAQEFSHEIYRVDILKLEFPAELPYVKEYATGVFDGREHSPLYSLQEVQAYCARLHAASRVPWVILSAGVGIEEFLVQLKLACDAGASGFLCGRAIWQDALAFCGNVASMREHLQKQGVYNLLRANSVAERALPWYAHRRHATL